MATIAFGLSRNFVASVFLLFLTGALDNISVVVRSTLIQTLTPDEMRGRVAAVNSIFIGMSNELGSFESGVAARLFGTVRSVVLGGVGTIAVVLWVGVEMAERLAHRRVVPLRFARSRSAALDRAFATLGKRSATVTEANRSRDESPRDLVRQRLQPATGWRNPGFRA